VPRQAAEIKVEETAKIEEAETMETLESMANQRLYTSEDI
jgi:hypothetical protein